MFLQVCALRFRIPILEYVVGTLLIPGYFLAGIGWLASFHSDWAFSSLPEILSAVFATFLWGGVILLVWNRVDEPAQDDDPD